MATVEEIGKIITDVSPYYKKIKDPSEEHKLIYDSSSETLEPVYFWVLDMMNSMFQRDPKNPLSGVSKLIDNFSSSPGSGHFSELMGKATKMQEEAMKIMQTTGILIKSMINIIYDLKEFEIRLFQYKQTSSKNKDDAEAGLLGLKQIWMDNVDMKRGAGSINALSTGQLNFVTLRDSFMMAKSVDDVKSMDLNDRVKRILEARIQEFFKWRELSERELRKRYEIEKTYLKNQLNSLKLYTRWAKPYLNAATQLEQNLANPNNPALVHAFNTIVFELTLFGMKKLKIEDAVIDKKLPESYKDLKPKRQYYSCVLIDFNFRGIPSRVGTNYVFGGRAEVNFRGYALNEEEIKLMLKKMENSDVNDALKLVSGMTDDSIKELQEDIDYFLKEETEREKEQEEKSNNINPFSALLGMDKKQKKKEDKKDDKKPEIEITEVKKDNYVERILRNLADASAREACFTVFDVYKKAHGMASHPSPEFEPQNTENIGKAWWGI